MSHSHPGSPEPLRLVPPGSLAPEELDDRYGRRPRRVRRREAVIAAVLLALAGGGWIAWAGWHSATPEVRGSLVSYRVVDATRVDTTIGVSRSSDRAVVCEVRAYDKDSQVVGRTLVTVPSGGARSRNLQVSVRTAALAVNGVLQGCRVG